MSVTAISSDPKEAIKYLEALKKFDCDYPETSDPAMGQKVAQYAIGRWEKTVKSIQEGDDSPDLSWVDDLFTHFLHSPTAEEKVDQTFHSNFTLINKIEELFDNLIEAHATLNIVERKMEIDQTRNGELLTLLEQADSQIEKSKRLIKEIVELAPHSSIRSLRGKVKEIEELYEVTSIQTARMQGFKKRVEAAWCAIM